MNLVQKTEAMSYFASYGQMIDFRKKLITEMCRSVEWEAMKKTRNAERKLYLHHLAPQCTCTIVILAANKGKPHSPSVTILWKWIELMNANCYSNMKLASGNFAYQNIAFHITTFIFM